jgi:hypothetical protein
MRLSLELSVGMSMPRSPLIAIRNIAQQYGGLFWGRFDTGITLGATLKAVGTSPPAVTISGSVAQFVALYVKIDGAGDETTATYRWSTDGGATFVQTARPVAGGPHALGSTGISVTFPAGTYAVDNIYRATASAWADQSLAGNNPTNAVAGQQPIVDVDGLLFDGVDDSLIFASTLSAPSGASFFASTNLITPSNSILFQQLERTYYANVVGLEGWSLAVNAFLTSGISLSAAQSIVEAVDRAPSDADVGVDGVIFNRTNGASYRSNASAAIGGDIGVGQMAHCKIREILFLGADVPTLVASQIRAYLTARHL